MKMDSIETPRRGRPDKIAPLKLDIVQLFVSHGFNDREIYSKLKDKLLTTMIWGHPDWNPDQLNAEIDNKMPSIHTIAAFRRSVETRQAEIEASGADRPWQSGTLAERPLPPETLPRIYGLKAKHHGLLLTTRMAQWMGRLCHLRLSDDWLYGLCVVYATKERTSELAGVPLDLAEDDSQLSELMASGKTMAEIPELWGSSGRDKSIWEATYEAVKQRISEIRAEDGGIHYRPG